MELLDDFRYITYIYENKEDEVFKLDNFLCWFQKYNFMLIEEKENFSIKEKNCVKEIFLNFFKLFKLFLKNTKNFTYENFKNKYFQNEEIHLFSTIKYLFLEKINLIIKEFIIEFKKIIKDNFFKIIIDFTAKRLEKEEKIKNNKDLKIIIDTIENEYDVGSYISSINNLISLCFAKYQTDNTIILFKKKVEDSIKSFKDKQKSSDNLINSLILIEEEKDKKIKEKQLLNKRKVEDKRKKEFEIKKQELDKKKEIFNIKQRIKVLKNYFNLFNIYKTKSKKSQYIIFKFVKYWLNNLLYKKKIQNIKIKSINIIIHSWKCFYLNKKVNQNILNKKEIFDKIKYLINRIKIYNFIYCKYFLKNIKIGDKVIINKKQVTILEIDKNKRTVVVEFKTNKIKVIYKGNSIKNILKIHE